MAYSQAPEGPGHSKAVACQDGVCEAPRCPPPLACNISLSVEGLVLFLLGPGAELLDLAKKLEDIYFQLKGVHDVWEEDGWLTRDTFESMLLALWTGKLLVRMIFLVSYLRCTQPWRSAMPMQKRTAWQRGCAGQRRKVRRRRGRATNAWKHKDVLYIRVFRFNIYEFQPFTASTPWRRQTRMTSWRNSSSEPYSSWGRGVGSGERDHLLFTPGRLMNKRLPYIYA